MGSSGHQPAGTLPAAGISLEDECETSDPAPPAKSKTLGTSQSHQEGQSRKGFVTSLGM